jgi:hypothetical protein
VVGLFRRQFMDVDTIFRRLRGALGNAVVWGVGWFAIGLALFATLRVVGIVSSSWEVVIGFALRAGVIGGVAGGAFAGVIRLLYHGRRLSEISWVRFGIGGGVFAGLLLPLFIQTMRLLSGDGLLAWELLLDDALLTAAFGGVAAGGSMKFAQLADALPPGDSLDHLDRLEGVDHSALEEERGP